jgi:hypothetical protein
MHLFSYESPSLELNFFTHPLILVVCLSGKSSTPHIRGFLHFTQNAFFVSRVSTCFVSETSPSHTHTTSKMSQPPMKCPYLGVCAELPRKSVVLVIMTPSLHCWVTLRGFVVGLGMAYLPTLRPQQLGSRTSLLWEGVPVIPMAMKFAPHLGAKLLEVLFPNGDQRNTQESLSKAKRKVYFCRRVQPQTIVW